MDGSGTAGADSMKFQIGTRGLIIITTWLAVFFANGVLASQSEYYRRLLDGLLAPSLVFIPASAIVGTIAGQHLLGMLCGLAGFGALIVWEWLEPIITY
jgi:hypothetical protein